MKLRNDTVILGLLAFVLLFCFGLNVFLGRRENAGKAITESATGDGYRFFMSLKNQLQQDSSSRWRKPLIEQDEFKSLTSYFLLSPKKPLSQHEQKFLLKWVEDGGNLIVSFKNEAALKRLTEILASAKITANVTDQPDFENLKSQVVKATQDSAFMRSGEQYQFYSYLGFRDGECLLHVELCYVREAAVGKGRVIAIAGLAPFANGLIDQGDNPKLATRMAEWSGVSAIDEFHQFMTERSLFDMAKDPTFSLPVCGFALMTILFFLFGNGDLRERDARPTKIVKALSYHALNREIVRRANAGSVSVEWHAEQLARIIPKSREEIQALVAKDGARPATLIIKLIRFHQEWLKKRGRTNDR